MDNAVSWIKENGLTVTNEHDDLVLLCIIRSNQLTFNGMGTDIYHISSYQYPTFAFIEETYDIVLMEHARDVRREFIDEIIPHWIVYYREDGTSVRGLKEQDMLNIINKCDHIYNKVECIQMYDELQADYDAYMTKYYTQK